MVSAPACAVDPPLWQQTLAADLILDHLLAAGEPFHVLHPESFASEVAHWLDTAQRVGLPFGLRFGKKANKSACFAHTLAGFAARGQDVGIDVASVEEFQAALSGGIPGHRLVVTGPTPTSALVRLSACHGATLTLSRPQDLSVVTAVLGELQAATPLDLLLRLASSSASTRFGMSREQALHLSHNLSDQPVSLKGVSFHCNGYSLEERTTMAHDAVDTLVQLRHKHPTAGVISIGGGFPTSSVGYEQWQYVSSNLTDDMFVNRCPGDQYPFGTPIAGADALAAIALAGETSLSERAREHNIVVWAEPGRSLCQGSGATYFPVLSCDSMPNQDRLVTVVNGTSLSMSEQWFNSEYYPDPYLLRDGRILSEGVPTVTAVAGSTCLDGDYISRRFIPLPDRPRPGDLLVYPDTAGYQMDSNESSFHDRPVPKKFVYTTSPHTRFKEDHL